MMGLNPRPTKRDRPQIARLWASTVQARSCSDLYMKRSRKVLSSPIFTRVRNAQSISRREKSGKNGGGGVIMLKSARILGFGEKIRTDIKY